MNDISSGATYIKSIASNYISIRNGKSIKLQENNSSSNNESNIATIKNREHENCTSSISTDMYCYMNREN